MRYSFPKLRAGIRRRLTRVDLRIKITLLFIVALALFPPFIDENRLRIYFFFLLLFVVALAVLSYSVIGPKPFKVMCGLWFVGSLVYLIFGIPLIVYSDLPLTPYMDLEYGVDRWLFLFALPIRLLGAFSVGLIFIAITSPIEFLRWKRVGLHIAVLYRAFERALHSLNDTINVLRMVGEWPDEQSANARLILGQRFRSARALLIITFRSTILWVPWAWVCFKAIRRDIIVQESRGVHK